MDNQLFNGRSGEAFRDRGRPRWRPRPETGRWGQLAEDVFASGSEIAATPTRSDWWSDRGPAVPQRRMDGRREARTRKQTWSGSHQPEVGPRQRLSRHASTRTHTHIRTHTQLLMS